MINWTFYPKTDPLPPSLSKVVNIFEKNGEQIDSSKNDTKELRKSSDKVLAVVANDFIESGYRVETGKKRHQKIRVPVLFGQQGKTSQAFEVDCWHQENKIVVEIEAGRAYTNHQFLKDIFETSMMVDVDYLVLAVRNIYIDHEDYAKISVWLETLHLTNRIKLELKGILLIGY
jgi:hypothetical protein|tara:strand:+ start:679 stop:1200 length:522 start_codon:yes stop_codon:yes gene_type:complete